MDDLIAFLRTQLDADERRILDGWDSDGKARVATMWTGGEPGYTTVASDHGDARWVANGFHIGDARHVTILWDPKRELAEIDAKRRIIDELLIGVPDGDPDGWVRDIARLLALPYADRPGYREEWRPA